MERGDHRFGEVDDLDALSMVNETPAVDDRIDARRLGDGGNVLPDVREDVVDGRCAEPLEMEAPLQPLTFGFDRGDFLPVAAALGLRRMSRRISAFARSRARSIARRIMTSRAVSGIRE